MPGRLNNRLKNAWSFAIYNDGQTMACCSLEGDLENRRYVIFLNVASRKKSLKILEVQANPGLMPPALFLPKEKRKLVCLFSRNGGSDIFLCDWEGKKVNVHHQRCQADFGDMAKFIPESSLGLVIRGHRSVIMWDLVAGKA